MTDYDNRHLTSHNGRYDLMPKSVAENVKNLVIKIITSKGISLREASSQIGISFTSIRRLANENMLSRPTLEKIKKWAANIASGREA